MENMEQPKWYVVHTYSGYENSVETDLRNMIENNSYKCRFSGVGHVAEQSPAAGAKLERGGTVTIVLK